MKHIVSNREVPHLWAHKTQDDARNSTGSLFFENQTIYSYGKHFPIAKHVTNARGESAILFTTCDYSVTTSGHTGRVRSSIPASATVLHVDLSSLSNSLREYDPSQAISDYNEKIDECERKAARARSEWSRNYELRTAAEWHGQAIKFCQFYDLPNTVRELSSDLETVKAACKADAARQAKETRERKAQAERDAADQIAAWMRGEYANLPYSLDTMLRIKNGEVETSRGAKFPVEHARRGLALVDAVVAAKETWQRNGHTCHLGNYQIDRIDANGTVHAGCHIVTLKAINAVRSQILSA